MASKNILQNVLQQMMLSAASRLRSGEGGIAAGEISCQLPAFWFIVTYVSQPRPIGKKMGQTRK